MPLLCFVATYAAHALLLYATLRDARDACRWRYVTLPCYTYMLAQQRR